jgi:hypothetical protein
LGAYHSFPLPKTKATIAKLAKYWRFLIDRDKADQRRYRDTQAAIQYRFTVQTDPADPGTVREVDFLNVKEKSDPATFKQTDIASWLRPKH